MGDMNSLLSPSQRTVCQLLANVLLSAAHVFDGEIDWNEVYREAKKQAVVIPAFVNLQDLGMEDGLKQEVIQAVNRHVYSSAQNYFAHDEVIRLLGEYEIDCCILKGVASAYYYPEQMIRQMGDVDFLVDAGQIEKAERVLEEHGYVLENHTHEHHINYAKDEYHFEMHFQPPGLPSGEMKETVEGYFRDIFQTSRKIEVDGFEYIVPDDFHHGLTILLHMYNHLASVGIGLRHLCDWAVFVNRLGNDSFVDIFEERFQAAGLWKFAQVMTKVSELALGLPHQEWAGEEDELAKKILADILTAGNFGHEIPQRGYEALFLARKGEHHSRLVEFFLSLNRIAYAHWPIFKKVRILIPVGYIFVLVRVLRKMAAGRYKGVNIVDMFSKSGERSQLYERLKMFRKD